MPQLAPMPRRRRALLALAPVAALLLAPGLALPAAADTVVPGDVVIQEVYGGGGNSGSTYTHDFVELRNTSDRAISIDGWSLQYSSAAGAFSAGNTLRLSGSVPAGATYLVQLAQGTGGTTALPTPDATGTLALSGTGGVVALSDANGALACTASACGSDPAVLDLLGWGPAKTFSGNRAAPATTNVTSVARTASTGENSTDFITGAPTPESTTGGETGPIGPVDPTDPPEPGAVVPIADIQGTGSASPLAGSTVTTEGVVTAVYATGGLDGYVLQTGGTGGALDLTTAPASTGIFVYSPQTVASAHLGDTVRVTGKVAEFNGSTQITVAAGGLTTAPEPEPAPVPVTLAEFPTDEAQREPLEHMLYQPGPDDFTVTDVYGTSTYGEVVLAIGDAPLRQAGETHRPGPEATAALAAQARQKVVLDDGRTTDFSKNPTQPMSYLTTEEPVRVGAHLDFTQPVVVGWSFSAWRLNPTTPWTDHATDGIDVEDTRTDRPADVGGDLQVGTFNVLNYFTTLGADTPGCQPYTNLDGEGTSVRGGCDLRGAWDAKSFERQQSKIVSAISATGTDVVGLMEIENSARLGEEPDEATATLVDALNVQDGAGSWAYVPTGPAYAAQGVTGGQDAITNAIIYRPGSVKPVGDPRILVGDPAFSNAREPIGQVFVPVDDQGREGEPFLFVVNHFKSKGSADSADAGLPADPVQGNSRTSRLAQARALDAWVSTTQAELGVDDVLLGGDLNAYTQEDPLHVLYDSGYTDVASTFDPEGWSYSYDDAVGSLDHVLANESAMQRITGADDWSINGPESPLVQYSRYRNNAVNLYEDGPFGSSDHNPLVVGLNGGQDGAPDGVFSDVPEDLMFHAEITWAAQNGYVKGWDDGTFRPLEPVHRDAMAAFLYRMAGEPEVQLPATSPFTDVKPTDEHYTAMVWAQQEGIATGWSDGTFRPTEPIARDAMAAFVYRYAGSPEYTAPVPGPFSDVTTEGQAYAREIAWLESQGVTAGYPDGTYRPLGAMNRDALAAFLFRMDAGGVVYSRG